MIGLLSCAGAGAWIAFTTPIPLVWSSGALVGTVLGVALVLGFLHLLDGSPAPRGGATPAGPHRR